jgi:hypothetical protein
MMENLTGALELPMDPEKEDYEVFDNRDLMNVVVHSVLCAGRKERGFCIIFVLGGGGGVRVP